MCRSCLLLHVNCCVMAEGRLVCSTIILQKRELLELKAKFTQLEKDAQEERRLPTFLRKKWAIIQYFHSSFFPAPPPSNVQYCKGGQCCGPIIINIHGSESSIFISFYVDFCGIVLIVEYFQEILTDKSSPEKKPAVLHLDLDPSFGNGSGSNNSMTRIQNREKYGIQIVGCFE